MIDLGILAGAIIIATLVTLVILLVVELAARLTLASYLPRTTERAVIGQIAAVVRQHLPQAAALAVAAGSERRLTRRFLYHIAGLLSRGLPLFEAVLKGMPNCSALTLSLIAAGQRTGQLAAALDQAEANLVERLLRRRGQPTLAIPYLLAITSLTVLLTSGIMIAIIPKLKEIFTDYKAILPGVTRSLVTVSLWVSQNGFVWVTAVALLVIALYLLVRPRRWGQPRLTSQLADYLRWHLPIARRLNIGRNMKAAYEIVRLGIRSGMDLAPAARLAGQTDLNVYLIRRFNNFADLLEQGDDIHQAAQAAGLGEISAISLTAGQRCGNFDAALRYLIDYHDALASRLAAVIRSLSVPLAVLVAASFAGWVVLALFMPLVALLRASTG